MIDRDDKFWLIDFDKCAEKGGDQWKAGNLSRLNRSLLKEQGKYTGYHFTPDDWQHLQTVPSIGIPISFSISIRIRVREC